MNDNSVLNRVINNESGVSSEQEQLVLAIYKKSPTPLTTNEMLTKYYEYISTIPATDPAHKILLSARHNGLKGARTSLTHKGLIREVPPRECTVTKRQVSVFKYVGIEYTELEKLQHELVRRIDDLNRVKAKIAELEKEIVNLKREAA